MVSESVGFFPCTVQHCLSCHQRFFRTADRKLESCSRRLGHLSHYFPGQFGQQSRCVAHILGVLLFWPTILMSLQREKHGDLSMKAQTGHSNNLHTYMFSVFFVAAHCDTLVSRTRTVAGDPCHLTKLGIPAAKFLHGDIALARQGTLCVKFRAKTPNGIWHTHTPWANRGASKCTLAKSKATCTT